MAYGAGGQVVKIVILRRKHYIVARARQVLPHPAVVKQQIKAICLWEQGNDVAHGGGAYLYYLWCCGSLHYRWYCGRRGKTYAVAYSPRPQRKNHGARQYGQSRAGRVWCKDRHMVSV